MKVFEVLVDFDRTTRSNYSSVGVFSTKEKAEAALKQEKLLYWQKGVVVERNVS